MGNVEMIFLMTLLLVPLFTFTIMLLVLNSADKRQNNTSEAVDMLREVVNYWYSLKIRGEIRKTIDDESTEMFNKAHKVLLKHNKHNHRKNYDFQNIR